MAKRAHTLDSFLAKKQRQCENGKVNNVLWYSCSKTVYCCNFVNDPATVVYNF